MAIRAESAGGPAEIATNHAVERLDGLIARGKGLLEAVEQPGNIDAHDLWYTESVAVLDLVAPELVPTLGEVWGRVSARWCGKVTPRAVSEAILGQTEVLRAARGTIQQRSKNPSTPTTLAAQKLRQAIPTTASLETRVFLDEAVTCLEHDLYRAAVVLSWIGAMSVLHHHVVDDYLGAFNREAIARDSKWKDSATANDLACMKERDFLNVVDGIGLIDKNTKQQLQQCLELRNGCGHPNTLRLGANKVAAHIEVLILNVFAKVG
jgi:hypothetical protein